MMTFADWIDSLPDDEREALCAADAWKAGAAAMLNELIDQGFISKEYAEDARKAVALFWQQ